ncbi:uncharacterized protein J4E78_005225 [Alternaria triticimaculans]|uniref:uncharacterized protein n=1 Tax=Alternaria triticimaculans TaxID=297637 RepID=UPI0020C2AA5F|nr:uncharacterized protein J4E78_005225 [Alternaria triticimaculans]KAI4660522.1 hypothetical protein J4E78_005225 [Alternaria triticimaculans]
MEPGTAITMFIIISMRIDKEAANGMLANIEETLSNNTKSFPLKQLVYTSDQPSNLVSYNILERTTRRNVRYDPFGNYPSPYIPVIQAIAKMEGVISCASVSIGGVVDAVGKLIKDITDSLRSAGGAKSEYQELTKELEALKAALDGLDQLDSSTAPSALLDTIKFIAADCRQRLEVFWAKIERYGSSLGPASQSNALRSTMDKLGWTFFQKEEVVQLQRNLQSYSNVINILMIRHVAGQVQDMRKDTGALCTRIAEQIRDTHDTLTDVGKEVSSQGVVASNIQTLVTGLHQFIFGEVRSFLADFGQLANKVFDVDEPSSSMASPSFNDPVRSPDRGVSDMEDRRSRNQDSADLSRLAELHLYRELKQSVLEYIIDLYQPAYPNNHGFSILICRHVFDRSSSIPAAAALGRRNDRADEFIMIRAVTLSEPGTKKWTLVAESSRACFGIVPALQEFSKDLERQMGNMTASMTVDKKRQRNERDEGSIDQEMVVSDIEKTIGKVGALV